MRDVSSAVRSRRGIRPAIDLLEGRRLLSTLMVDDDLKQCPQAQYTSIQAAVTAAGPNDTIDVCPGTYREQVTIPAGKDGLKLIAEKPGKVTIQAPAAMTANAAGIKAIVEVDAMDAVLQGFTISGPTAGIDVGVLIDQGGSATIRQNEITDIHDDPLSSRPRGIGVYVRNGTGRILGNAIDDYQAAGILVANAGSSADVGFNTVNGVGTTSVIGQIGIQVSDGATAIVHDNTVSNNLFTQPGLGAVGILVFQPGSGVKVLDNTLTKNNFGIVIDHATSVSVTGNSVSKSTFDGIDLIDSSTGIVVANNESRKNGGDGIFVDATSTDNTIRGNQLKQNKNFDAEDQSLGSGTAGTANIWQDNEGKTSSPPGLVQKGHGHDHGHGHGHGDGSDDQGDDGPPWSHGHGHVHSVHDDGRV